MLLQQGKVVYVVGKNFENLRRLSGRGDPRERSLPKVPRSLLGSSFPACKTMF